MEYKNIEDTIKEAEDCWNSDHPNNEGKEYKVYFILGWLKNAYRSIWEELPKSKKKINQKINN